MLTSILPLPETDRGFSRRIRQSTFKRILLFAGLIAVLMMVLVGFIYWQTVEYLEGQIDTHLLTDARAICTDPGPMVSARLLRALNADHEHMRVGAIFDRAGQSLVGNLATPPIPLPSPYTMGAVRDPTGHLIPGHGTIRVGMIPLPNDTYLVFGRRVGELDKVNRIVSRALALALLPLIGLALSGGAILSRFTMRRLRVVEHVCKEIRAGRYNERLPLYQRGNDEFHALSVTVNEMLDDTERSMLALKSAGESIAHDLRTPLTRLGARLDRVLERESDLATIRATVDSALLDINQLIGMTRAILRLSELESGKQRAAFGPLDLAVVCEAVADLYSAPAEEKSVVLSTNLVAHSTVFGDEDLIFECIGNIVDNAVKFTPPGGTIRLETGADTMGPYVRVSDTGPGIPEPERTAVLGRFYRSDRTRSSAGLGLGLAIVAAIARLHEADLTIGPVDAESGCLVELRLPAHA